MFEGYKHLVDFDFKHARKETRPYACTWSTPLDTLKGGWLRPKTTLEDYGFHIIPLPLTKRKPSVRIKGQNVIWDVIDINGNFFLVVMAAPKEHQMLTDHPRTYPYQLKIN
jgi:hypothetical protein